MHSEWKVTSNYINKNNLYTVYRIRDNIEIDHSGNREFATGYMEDKEEAIKIAAKLNEKERIEISMEIEKYPECKVKTCPFCGCMSDDTCRIHNVAKSAPWLILEHADKIDYCYRPKVFMSKLKEREKI